MANTNDGSRVGMAFRAAANAVRLILSPKARRALFQASHRGDIRDMKKIDFLKTMSNTDSLNKFGLFEDHLKVGQEAPDFTLRDTDNNQVSLSDFQGKVVVLEFGAYT